MNTALEVARMQMKGMSAREAFEAVKNEINSSKSKLKDCLEERLWVCCLNPSASIPEKSRAAFSAF